MAGKISWQLEITGLDQALIKLREVDRLLSSITRHRGMLNLNVGSFGTPTGHAFGPVVATPSATATVAAAGFGARAGSKEAFSSGQKFFSHIHPDVLAAQAEHLNKNKTLINEFREKRIAKGLSPFGSGPSLISPAENLLSQKLAQGSAAAEAAKQAPAMAAAAAFLAKMRAQKAGISGIEGLVPKGYPSGVGAMGEEWMGKVPVGSSLATSRQELQLQNALLFGAGLPLKSQEVLPKRDLAKSLAFYSRLPKSSDVYGSAYGRGGSVGIPGPTFGLPPMASPPYSGPIGPGLKDAFTSQGIKNILVQKLLGGGIGGSGGGGGLLGLLSGGSFSKMFPAVIALTAAFAALHKVVHILTEAIKHGAEAYQMGARHGGSVGASFQLKSAFEAIGMGGGAENAMMAIGQFNTKAKKTTLSGGEVIGAMRAGQFANVQQLTNMSKEFEAAMRDAGDNARQMASAGKASQETNSQLVGIQREWQTLLTQISTELYPIIHSIADMIKSALEAMNALLEVSIKLKQILHIIPAGEPGKTRIPGMGTQPHSVVSAWEKIGFVFGGGKLDYSKEIAHNTKETNSILRDIQKGARIAGAFAPPLRGVSQMLDYATP